MSFLNPCARVVSAVRRARSIEPVEQMQDHCGRRTRRSVAALALAALCGGALFAQFPVSAERLAKLRADLAVAASEEAARQDAAMGSNGANIAALPVLGVLEAQLATDARSARGGLNGAAVDLYTGLQPGPVGRQPLGGVNGFWSYGQTIYWALDDGVMGPAAAMVGGGHVTEYEFAFGVHGDFAGDQVQPMIVVNIFTAPPDPVASAANPVVSPGTLVSSLAWLFSPITIPAAGNYAVRTFPIDLEAFGYDFDLDESFYIEIIPLEWDALKGEGVRDPDVHAVFTGPGTVTYGDNQDRMWSDVRRRGPGGMAVLSDRDGLYDHPAEMDIGGFSPRLNQSGFNLRGVPCEAANILQLRINEPADVCVRPGETVTVTLSQRCLPGLVRGYQAFLGFDAARLSFGSGTYIRPLPYDLPILDPVFASGGEIDLAAGINDVSGQTPTSAGGDLVTLSFVAGAIEGLTSVVFRAHQPPTRFSNPIGLPVVPTTLDSPPICIDGTPPMITCPPDQSFECLTTLPPPPAVNLGTFVSQGGNAVDSGCAGPITFSFVGDSLNSGTGCPGSPRILTRTYRAEDCAGNAATCSQTFTWLDNVPPVVSGCPGAITVPSQAPGCGATVSWTPPSATDNCTAVSVSASHSPGAFFPVGTTPVTYTFTDACGNSSVCTFTVTVEPEVEFRVSVQLQPTVSIGTIARCIRLEFWNCPGAAPAHTANVVMSFSAGVASDVIVRVPCGPYSCVTARDPLHTLRRTDDTLIISSGQYVVDFTGPTRWLIGGNLNDDEFIDILDYGLYLSQYATNYGTPNTTCATPAPHADLNGNGTVTTADATFILLNFLAGREPNCCGAADGSEGDGSSSDGPSADGVVGDDGRNAGPPDGAGRRQRGPVTRISLAELEQRGMGKLRTADVNRDGWLDEQDIAAHMAAVAAPPGGVRR